LQQAFNGFGAQIHLASSRLAPQLIRELAQAEAFRWWREIELRFVLSGILELPAASEELLAGRRSQLLTATNSDDASRLDTV
jgi:hypothetical protein